MPRRPIAWLALAAFLGLTTPIASAEGLALLVPAYFEPSSGGWQRLALAAAQVPLVAIANLFNGPGEQQTLPEYDQAIRAVRAAGGQAIGYVFTGYGSRPLDAVKLDMRHWHERYPLDGFFVDEMANQNVPPLLEYYGELRRYALELHPDYRVVGNPGTNTDEAYLKRPTVDALVIFEHHTGYATFVPAAWTKAYAESQFGHLAYAIPTPDAMTNVLNLAQARRAGFIYVTDDSGDNPWDTLPSYWDAEVASIAHLNQAAAEQLQAHLNLSPPSGTTLTLTARGTIGRRVLEAASPLGEWRSVGTNLTNTGTSVWQILNLPANRFFRTRQD